MKTKNSSLLLLCLKLIVLSCVTLITITACKKSEQKTAKIAVKPYQSTFYKAPPLFQYRADENKTGQAIDRFGPVGIGIELHKPAFVMKVKNVEEGSPAAKGGLKQGMFIDTINGQVLAEIDPRIQLGRIITDAEASDGIVEFVVREKEGSKVKTVKVKIPVLGSYATSWPLKCKKSDAIVSNLADFLRKKEEINLSYLDAPALLFMLSTGEEKDLAVARKWVKKIVEKHGKAKTIQANNWTVGRFGTALCEYFLRTGDKSIIPVLELLAAHAKWDMYNDGWAHGMYQGKSHMQPGAGMAFGYMGGGHMNACGVHMPSFILLAKECGVDVDESMLQSSLKQFYRFASHGAVPYGDQLPEPTYVDNGRDGGLAFSMAAAASLTPEGEDSVYAKARDHAAVKGFYSTSWMLIGHTGGGVGELWRSASMGLMYDKKPTKYREFMDNRKWFYELSRRFDGSFGILGGFTRYDKPNSWGVRMGLSYTVPRKTLRLTGAPKTKYSKSYQLPKRPWGTKADDDFHSIEYAAQADGKVLNVDEETLREDASRPVGSRMNNPNVSDEVLMRYAHHPDHGIRQGAAGCINKHGRYHLVPELLRSKNTRVRHVGAMAIYGTFKRTPMETENVTAEMVELLMKMINDPNESLWAKENALRSMGQASAQLIKPYAEELIPWLSHDEWWLAAAVMRPLSKVVSDKKYCEKIFKRVGNIITNNTRVSLNSSINLLVKGLEGADSSIQKLAVDTLAMGYLAFPKAEQLHGTDRISMKPAVDVMLRSMGQSLSGLEGGLDALYKVGKQRHPDEKLPQKRIFLSANPKLFSPAVKKAFLDVLVPEFIETNRSKLEKEIKWEPVGGMFALGALDELAGLHRKIGDYSYDWKDFGPDRLKMKWHYHSFDPKEQKRWLPGVRYRKVSTPKGMEKWYSSDFNAEKEGWKTGYAPFGQENGKIRESDGCSNSICRCADKMETLWEKEVLLLSGKFSFPTMKEGYRYRLLIGGGSHVNGGDGYAVYINGKLLTKAGRGPRKREGGKPRGVFISKKMAEEFNKGEVNISVISFLKMHPRSQVIGNYMTVWVQEMKIPPL
jgi:hypothetical protein